jgi:3-oxoacyl-[acyl-carrier protein] reductase
VKTALDAFGGVDILVNNAGIALAKPIWETDPDLFTRVCDSHVKGTFFCTRHAVPHMMANRWGRIVNLVSRAGLIGVPANGAYAAGKGGVFGLTNVAARDLAEFGITVNGVNPSSTETRMVTDAVEKFRKQGGDAAIRADALMKVAQQPEDVAVLIAGLCSEEAAGINGQIFFVQKGEIGLFQPLTIGQRENRPNGFGVDDLIETLGRFTPNPLDTPYGR